MPVTTIGAAEIQVDAEGFMTEYGEWDEDIARQLAAAIGIELTDAHWKAIRFLREDYPVQGETATLRRVATLPASRSRSCSRCSPASPPRRWPTSPGCPSHVAACEREARHEHHPDGPARAGDRPRLR